jgi:FAD/FMN-containing dehydrogenase
MGQAILRLYHFQFAHASYTERHRVSARSFRGLIDLAIARGGSYYLTYHKFAKPEQVTACYPQFKEFLDLKRKYDPAERFQSDWCRYYRKLFAS